MRGSSGYRLERSPANEKVSTLNRFDSAATVGRIHSQRPCSPGINTSGGPLPTSIVRESLIAMTPLVSVPERLACLQGVLDAVARFLFAAQRHEGLTFEVEQVLLVDARLVRQRPS